MGRTRGDFLAEIVASIMTLMKIIRGWKMVIPPALLLLLLVFFGIARALIILLATLGIGFIVVVVRTNDRWIASQARKSHEKSPSLR